MQKEGLDFGGEKGQNFPDKSDLFNYRALHHSRYYCTYCSTSSTTTLILYRRKNVKKRGKNSVENYSARNPDFSTKKSSPPHPFFTATPAIVIYYYFLHKTSLSFFARALVLVVALLHNTTTKLRLPRGADDSDLVIRKSCPPLSLLPRA